MRRVTCSDCTRFTGHLEWCTPGQRYVRSARALRSCAAWRPIPATTAWPTIAAARERLLEQGLDHFVLTLADSEHGRWLRLAAGIDDETRAAIYKAVGLRVRPMRRVSMRGPVASQQRQTAAGRAA